MCEIGSWRSFHSRTINGTLCAMQQCTECGTHRAVGIDDCQFVSSKNADNQPPQDRSSSMNIPEPDDDDEGSVWGPSS